MSAKSKSSRSSANTHAPSTRFRDGVFNQTRSLRMAVRNGGSLNPPAEAIQETIEQAFGAATYKARREADRKIYQVKGDVLNFYGKRIHDKL